MHVKKILQFYLTNILIKVVFKRKTICLTQYNFCHTLINKIY